MSDNKNRVADPFADYKKKYYSEHPETALRWRITAAINLLIKHGYAITEPDAATEAGESVADDV